MWFINFETITGFYAHPIYLSIYLSTVVIIIIIIIIIKDEDLMLNLNWTFLVGKWNLQKSAL